MILITLSNKAFENDVYPLVKAFFPKDKLKVQEITDTTSKEEAMESSSDANRIIDVEFEDQKLRITIMTNLVLTSTVDTTEESLKEFKESLGNWIMIGQESIHTVSFLKERSNYKNSMKRLLYKMLTNITNKELPWGILTGIRPTKLVYDLIEKGASEEEIYRHMTKEYLCTVEKVETSIQIARRELELLHEMDYKNGYSLYIGIPFCPTTCLYCSFTSYPLERFGHMVEGYLEALEKEIRYAATALPNRKLTTVYFGGGTPTTLTAEQLDRILGLVKAEFDFTHVKEFCVEAGRPDSITREKLEVLKKWGVDRISINPQTMQQRTLDLIGRKHTVDQIKDAYKMARETGHENINMDLILGLPGENLEDVHDTLRQIEELNPDSLTIHTLAIKRAARLNIEKDDYKDMAATDVSKMLDATTKYASKVGYIPYYLYRQKNMADNLENVGYSRKGLEGLYNILIMEEQQTILALGAGAMSKFVFHDENRLERVDNVKSISDYISRIDEMIQRKVDFIKGNGLV